MCPLVNTPYCRGVLDSPPFELFFALLLGRGYCLLRSLLLKRGGYGMTRQFVGTVGFVQLYETFDACLRELGCVVHGAVNKEQRCKNEVCACVPAQTVTERGGV